MKLNSTTLHKVINQIKKEYRFCRICPLNCRINRHIDQTGNCGVGLNSKIFNAYILAGETKEIAPTYAIYFAGCNMQCLFCSVGEQNKHLDYSDKKKDYSDIDDGFINKVRKEIGEAKPKTIGFIGGEPTIHLYSILDLIQRLKPDLPLVLFTNLYYKPHINQILLDVFDYIIGDCHYGNGKCGRSISKADDYFQTAVQNISKIGYKLILRHLLLPGHLECCFKPLANWLNINQPDMTLHLLTSYVPYTDQHGLGRRLSPQEIMQAIEFAQSVGLKIETLNLLHSAPGERDVNSQTQEVLIDDDGATAFKYLDGTAVEIGHTLDSCHSEPEQKHGIASLPKVARNDKKKGGHSQ